MKITTQTKIDLRLFEAPISLFAKSAEATVFEGYTNFNDGQLSPDLDKAITSICKALGIEAFLKTEVKLQEVFGHFNWSENRLFVQGIIPLEHTNARLMLNYQPSKDNPKEQDFAVILDFQFFFDLDDLPIINNDLDEQLHLTLAFANNSQEFQTVPFEQSEYFKDSRTISIKSGVGLKSNINFPNDLFEFDYELKDFTPEAEQPHDFRTDIDNLPKLPEQKGTKWYDVNKNFGGLNFRKVGMRWQQNKAWVLLNLDYMSSGLEFTLLGLQAGTPLSLKTFRPKFDLYGIGIYFKNNFVELGGSLLKVVGDDKTPVAYIGKMLMRFANMNVGAIGGFTKTKDGKKSFFAFANVGVPLGGIPAFFVNGLSAGFGYNSELNLPNPNQIADYPLLNIIKTGKKNPSDALAYLGNIVNAKNNEKWLAAGVQFTSFQLIDSNAILAYQFGKKEIAILGVSRLILPSKKAAYLNLQFGLKAIYRIQSGEIQSNAQLADGSYLIHDSVNLSGSVAVYTWLKGENAGDFVLTIGGYHPRFEKPAHYPTVPKVGFSWIVSDTMKISGNTYFALTNQAIMAGFSFDATYQKGKLKAWFKASSDLILQWKPFYYDFHTKIRVGAKYQSRFLKNYKLDVGADLHLYGPEMGGYVNINWSIISFNIRFGNPTKARFIYVLDWEMFHHSFLPQQEIDVCRVNISNGLIEETSEENSTDKQLTWIVNSDNLAFSTQSLIPSNQLIINNQLVKNSSDTLGIRPMNKQQLQSTQTVTIRNANEEIVELNLQYQAKQTNFSPALWSAKPLKRQQLEIEKLQSVSGFDFIIPIATPNGNLATEISGQKQTIKCQFESETNHIAARIISEENTIKPIAKNINQTTTRKNRTAIIDSLNDIFELSNDELLPNDNLKKIEKNAEFIFQSEPKIGQIQRIDTQTATPKILIQPLSVETLNFNVSTMKPIIRSTMNDNDLSNLILNQELTSRGLQATSTDTKVMINVGSAYVFELDDKSDISDIIEFESNCLIQVIEFNEFNHILDFHVLPSSMTAYQVHKKAKRLALKGIKVDSKFDGWNHTEIMPLVNDNALLGNLLYVKLQVPIANEEITHRSIKKLDETNFIKTAKGTQKGYIDTILFKDYQEVIVIVKPLKFNDSTEEQCKDDLNLSIPCSYRNHFNRQLHTKTERLKPVTSAIDADGNIRIKYKLSNSKIGKKSEKDLNWNGFMLRIESNENWKICSLRLYENMVRKKDWMS
ncbi:MAG: DUF6603 domain-containing protein [Saprospiraceae bacterium]